MITKKQSARSLICYSRQIVIFVLALSFIGSIGTSRAKYDEANYLYNPLSPFEIILPHGPQQEKTCVTLGLGLQVLERMCLQVATQYIAKFNEHQYKNIQDYEVHPIIGNYTVNLKHGDHLVVTNQETDHSSSQSDKLFKLSVEIPVAVTGKHRSQKWTHTFQGKSKIQFGIQIKRAQYGNITTWKMLAFTDKAFTKMYLEGRTCVKMTQEECDKIFNQLDNDMHRLVFPYDFGSPDPNFFFNQPTAIRTTLGLMDQVNNQLNNSETQHAWIDDQVIGFNIGCTKKEIQEILDGQLKADLKKDEVYISSQGNTFGSILSQFLSSEIAVSLNITDKDFEVQPFEPRTLERQETLKVFKIPANASTGYIRVERDKHPERHEQLVLFEMNPSQIWDMNLNIVQQFFKFNLSSNVVQKDLYFNKFSPHQSTIIDDDTLVRLLGSHKKSWLDEVNIKGTIWLKVDDDVDQPAWLKRRAKEKFIEKDEEEDDDQDEEKPPEDIGEEVGWKPNYNYIDLSTELHPSHLKNKSLLNISKNWQQEAEEEGYEDGFEEGELPEIDDYFIIMPVEFELRFLYQQRRGMSTIFGFTQEVKTKVMDNDDFFKISIGECFLTPNPDYNETLGDMPKYIDSEVCNKTEALNLNHLKAELIPAIEKAFKLRQSMAARNDYFPVPAIDYSFQLLCTGLQLKQPQFGFEKIKPETDDSRMVVRFPFKEKAMDISGFCDTYEPHMVQVDPRQIRQNRTKYYQIQEYVKNVQDNQTSGEMFAYLSDLFAHGFNGYFPEEHRDIKLISPMVHLLSSYYPLREWCRVNQRTWHPDRCALFFAFQHDHAAYDDFGDSRNNSQADCKIQIYYNFQHQFTWLSGVIELVLWSIGYVILFVGVFMYLTSFGPSFSENRMVLFVFLANVVLHLPGLLRVNYRQGIDYSAYITQAGCVVAGETRYSRISSLQGPCFYPAGHLWFFVPAYILHITTEHAEIIMKFVFFVLHSMNLSLVIKIAYKYFQHNKERAQLVGFILLANAMDRDFVQLQFNDNILAFALTATIYFIVTERPLLSMAMFSFGLSVKAGALLFTPAVLGCIQYRFGILALIQGFLVALSVQYVLGFTFMMRDTDSYILDSRLFGHGPGKPELVGAKYENSIYWTFVSREVYYSKEFNDQLKLGILVLNTVFFFVRQNCSLQCILNIFAPFAAGPRVEVNTNRIMQTIPQLVVDTVISTHQKLYYSIEQKAKSFSWSGVHSDPVLQMQKSVEILVFGLLVGPSLMPGGHRQFMLWYINIIPLAIEMLGLPWWLTAWWYQLVWPVDICSFDDRWIHQVLTFFIVGWLLTIGASRKKVYGQSNAKEKKKQTAQKKVKTQ